MDHKRRAVSAMIELLWFQQCKDLLEPLIRAGMKKFDLDFWEFKPQPTTKSYKMEQVNEHLRQTDKLPTAELFNWLLNEHRIRHVKAKRRADNSIEIYWLR